MLKMVIFKKRMWFSLCMLLIGLMMAPGLVVGVDKVNINTADVEALSSLPGVGPVTAGRIIEYREKNGPFKNKEEITKIKGIGEKTFQKMGILHMRVKVVYTFDERNFGQTCSVSQPACNFFMRML